MRQKLLTSDHPDFAKSLYLVGDRLRQTGNLNDSYSILNATLLIQRKLLGKDSPAALDTMGSIALTLEAEHKLSEAEQLERETLAFWMQRGESECPSALSTLESLGATLESENKWAEAERVYREALSVWRKRAEPETPQVLREVENLSRAFVAQKKFGDVEALLDDALTPAVTIKAIESVLTVVDGKVVHATNEFSSHVPPIVPVLPEWSPVKVFGGYAPLDVAKAARAGVPVPHYNDAHCHSHGCVHAAHQLLAGIEAARNRYSGFFGLGCDCFAF
ncbi:MAG TPA: tetratricopeptide repeat protein [Verrucomicrobiae bacterium]|jgi:tetratricopeptide (TPR) repeat protein|nr:tetratricopeptide repeat protein [Verrucomicrobiae bacterium]